MPDNPHPRVRLQSRPVQSRRLWGPSWDGTIAMCLGLLITGTLMTGDTPDAIARYAAIGAAISIGVSVIADLKGGFGNLVRADIMAICALYGLTFFEFLFPQEQFNDLVERRAVPSAVWAVIAGFMGLALGRHCFANRKHRTLDVFTRPVRPSQIILIYTFSLVLGYLHQFLAVDFNLLDIFYFYLEPRFSQPWGRGKFGDWKALINELGLLIYLIPPLAGVVFARWRKYSMVQIIFVGAGLLWTLFYGFSSGTRNVFACFLVTFMIGYLFATDRHNTKKVLILGSVCAILLMFATKVMLDFRQVGLRNYWNDSGWKEKAEESLFVDYNLYVICHLVALFPDRYPYLGWEVPYNAAIRPIPRAVWPEKPEGMSISIEDALGVEGLTLAASFVGEAYLIDGMWTVFLVGALFGALAAWWSRMASPNNSDFGILIYASGFFAAVISMRSLFVFTTAVLPTIAAIVGGTMLLQKARSRRGRTRLRVG